LDENAKNKILTNDGFIKNELLKIVKMDSQSAAFKPVKLD
jgi:hypothetical protein